MRNVLAPPVVLIALHAVVVACSKSKTSASANDPGAAGSAQNSPQSGGLAFLNGFEGEIDAVIQASGEPPTPLAVFVKGGKLRIDMPESVAQKSRLGSKAYVLFDSTAKMASVVSDAQQQVLVLDLNRSGEQLKGLAQGFKGAEGPHAHPGTTPQKPPPKITKTGKFDTVAGYKCENWDITTSYREGTVCVAQEGASWFSLPATGIPAEQQWLGEILDGNHFPLRFISYAEDGSTEKSRGELTKIDKKAPAATEFAYPPSYRVIDLAQMFRGLAGGPSGMPMPMLPRAPRGKAQ